MIIPPDYYDHSPPDEKCLPLLPFQISCMEERAEAGHDIFDEHLVMVRVLAVESRLRMEELLDWALAAIREHAALRCSIGTSGGRYVQCVSSVPTRREVARRVVTDCGPCEARDIRSLVCTVSADDPYPIRLAFGECPEGPVIGIGVHHYFCDELSLDVLTAGLGRDLPPGSDVDYIGYCRSLQPRLSRHGAGERTHAFWRKQLSDLHSGQSDISRIDPDPPDGPGQRYDDRRTALSVGFADALSLCCSRSNLLPLSVFVAAVRIAVDEYLDHGGGYAPILVLRDPRAPKSLVGAFVNNCVVPLSELLDAQSGAVTLPDVLQVASGKILRSLRHCMLPLSIAYADMDDDGIGQLPLTNAIVVNAILDLGSVRGRPVDSTSNDTVEFFTDRGVDFPFVEFTFYVTGGADTVLTSYSSNRHRHSTVERLTSRVIDAVDDILERCTV